MAIYNFNPGPSVLPREVYEQSAKAILDLDGTGLSLLEVSHRGKEFTAILDEAVALTKELLAVPAGYDVVFLQGGASLQFDMIPMNYLGEGESAAYLETGTWAEKAIKEAKIFGNPVVVGSSKDKNYSYIPKTYQVPADAKFFHVTSNNTIFGTQQHEFPKVNIPLVSDMSSDIFSRVLDISKFGLIYAGAQKNLACAGVTLVILKKDFVAKANRKIPIMLDFEKHIAEGSMYNTPPCFSIYVALLTLRWLKAKGGVAAMQKNNEKKAAKLYAEIDRNTLFTGTAAKEDRSLMNVCFVAKDAACEEAFLAECKKNKLVNIKGHRSVGGFRASIYNAMPEAGIDALINVMQEFEKNYK